jgi:hypothetical protein
MFAWMFQNLVRPSATERRHGMERHLADPQAQEVSLFPGQRSISWAHVLSLCLAKLSLTFTTQGAQAMNMSHTEALNHNQPQIVLAPSKPALRDGASHAFELLVRIQAPDVPPTAEKEGPPRPAQALALVIDSSGSMEGRSPGASQALRAMGGLADASP